RLAVTVEAEAGIDAALEHVVEHEVEGGELGQVVADDFRRLTRGEDLRDALGSQCTCDRGIIARIAADHGEIEPVALVAGAGIDDVVQLNASHAGASIMLTLDLAKRRSIRHEALASRGVTCRRTPAPPAGPAQ